MKFLVLSCNTDNVHNSAAKAICERIELSGHECDFKDTFEYCSRTVYESVCDSYDEMSLHTPKVSGAGYRYAKSNRNNKSAVYALNMTYSKRIYNDVLENNYDAIICTHVFPAQSVTHAKHKYGLNIPVYIVATDYSYCPFYDEIDVDKFFVSTKEVIQEYTDRGIPEEKIIPTGIPVANCFSSFLTRDEAREILGLPKDRFICLIMSDCMEHGNIYELIDKIIKKPLSQYDIIAITGNNHKLRCGILDKYYNYSNICTLGYTNKVHLYMKSSDLIITAPDGHSSTEAMVCGVPLILTAPISGCETENYRLLTTLGIAIGGKETDDAVFGFESILINKHVGEFLVCNMHKFINRNAAADICNTIIGDLTKSQLNERKYIK